MLNNETLDVSASVTTFEWFNAYYYSTHEITLKICFLI